MIQSNCNYCCEVMCNDIPAIMIVFQGEGSVAEARKQWRPALPRRTRYSQSFRDKVVLLRVPKRIETRSTAGLAPDATVIMHERWLAVSKRQSRTRTSSPCCGSTRQSAAASSLTLHARVGGAVSRLAHPPGHTTLCSALHDLLLLGHTHTLSL